ncbi:hypothetical protein EVAR_8133_1 [Eumeta japonica]|uniref:Uncharacterized protein n=1 Tax=Eumeta variegata TaxID=151549 RepID=A0A4C1TSS8_EUMVA|nr:hypothetical protein EVAR_8133_1 [Eumeta japonica]
MLMLFDMERRVSCCEVFFLTVSRGKTRRVKCHTFTKYGLEVAASAVAFRPVSESFGGPLPLYFSIVPSPFQEASNALATPSEAIGVHGLR